tara:strand:+ start:8183 stop:9028 length:846 start_codon:yes stop_codon:yes gene_type:complete
MPLQIAFGDQSGAVSEHLLFEGIAYKLGRSSAADVVVQHPQVSRLHATLCSDMTDTQWTLDDTSSTGCYVNGKAVKHMTVEKNAIVHFGPVACRLTYLSPDDVARYDSQYFWRKQQLRQHEKALHTTVATASMLDVARHCLLQTLGCERAAMLLLDENGEFEQAIGHEPWMDSNDFSGSRTVIRKCIHSREPIAIGDILADDTFNAQQSVIRFGIKAALCVPIIVEDEVVGVLYGDNTQGRQYFSQTDVKLTQALANMLSLRLLFHAIEHNISLVKETRYV